MRKAKLKKMKAAKIKKLGLTKLKLRSLRVPKNILATGRGPITVKPDKSYFEKAAHKTFGR